MACHDNYDETYNVTIIPCPVGLGADTGDHLSSLTRSLYRAFDDALNVTPSSFRAGHAGECAFDTLLPAMFMSIPFMLTGRN